MVSGEAPALLASGLAFVYSSLKVITTAPRTVTLRLDTDRDPSALRVGRDVVRPVGFKRAPDLRGTQRPRGWKLPSAHKFSCWVTESRLELAVLRSCAVLLLPFTAMGSTGRGLADTLPKHCETAGVVGAPHLRSETHLAVRQELLAREG